jgi:hypothetical protein
MSARSKRYLSPRERQVRATLALIGGLALLLMLAPVLAHAQTDTSQVTLAWTAPGDDGAIGTAANYEIRIAEFQIDDSNWSQAVMVSNIPNPLPAGSRQTITVTNLDRAKTYWFALKSVDDQNNESVISNVVRWDWVYDTQAPAAPNGVTAAPEGPAARIRWSQSPATDLAGYSVFRRTVSGGPFTLVSGGLVGATEFLDNSIPTGTDMVWYQITATDDSGNESSPSNAVAVSFTQALADWQLDPVYPNPSKLSDPVRIPFVVPTATAPGASIEITNAAGHVVRRIDVSQFGPGPQTVNWDGRNQSGRDVSPGVYTAWLVAGDVRRGAKLVRVP